jgi:hypothetical protein
MSKPALVAAALCVLSLSCATSSSQPKAPSTPQAKPGVATPAPEPVAEADPNSMANFMTRPKLEAGHCVDGFDCTDTVGLPPSGYRWSCDNGKCAKVKLPVMSGGQPAAAEEAKTAAEDSKPKAKSSKRRRRAN